MPKAETKFGGLLGVRIESDALEAFIRNAEACKSTKDIVLRELVYAFNRYCEAEGGRFPVLQRLEVVAPGYTVNEGKVKDATPGMLMLAEIGSGGPAADALSRQAGLYIQKGKRPAPSPVKHK